MQDCPGQEVSILAELYLILEDGGRGGSGIIWGVEVLLQIRLNMFNEIKFLELALICVSIMIPELHIVLRNITLLWVSNFVLMIFRAERLQCTKASFVSFAIIDSHGTLELLRYIQEVKIMPGYHQWRSVFKKVFKS